MKKNILYILIVQIAILFSACTRDDLYIDPSSPLEATPQTMLTSLQVNTFMNYEGEFARVASIMVQQTAGIGGQYEEMQNYYIYENAFSNSWEGLYTNTMYNARLLETKYSEGNPYYLGLSKIFMAMNLGLTTDLWGDVPFSDAFKAEDGQFSSKYDSQEKILQTIQVLLSDAVVQLSKSEADNAVTPDADDLIFEGDIASWIKMAWILKARYANRLSLKDPVNSADDVIEFITNADNIADAADNMEAPHSAAMKNQWADFQSERGTYLRANKYFIDVLVASNDPRLSFYFSPIEGGGYVGADITQVTMSSTTSVINTKSGGYFNVNRSFPLVTESEKLFLLAEAKQRKGQDASTDLNDAIKASVSYVTGGGSDGTSLATYTSATATLESIMVEKWKAMFGQVEPYNDYRRTGYPAITPRPQSVGASTTFIPKSFTTPQAERLYNEYTVVHDTSTPVWWAVAP